MRVTVTIDGQTWAMVPEGFDMAKDEERWNKVRERAESAEQQAGEALMRADRVERERDDAVLAEREACAKVAESVAHLAPYVDGAAAKIAGEIRARK